MQFRAVWLASVANIDWPSRPGLSAAEQQVELTKIFDEVVALGLNAVILQVRPTADALYRSKLNPWSKWLTGVPGQDPGYDPLAFAVTEAHRRGLELHAWFNPYRISNDTDRAALVDGSFAKAHPEYVIEYGGKLFYDPGQPAVREHIIASISEVVTNYAIDGVHLDDYFYPYPAGDTPFADEATYAQFGGGQPLADWRRSNVDALIEALSRHLKSIRPELQFGISPFGIWRNRSPEVPEGSATRGMDAYAAIYANSRRWVQEGWLDYVVPQLYYSIGHPEADYATLLNWWADLVADTPVKLYIGHGVYLVGEADEPAWQQPGEIGRQLALSRTRPEVTGAVFFSFKRLRQNPLGVQQELRLLQG